MLAGLNGFDVYSSAFAEAFAPRPTILPSEWAAKNRRLGVRASPEPAPWDNARTPYLVEIMDHWADSSTMVEVDFIKGSQLGGTEAIYNMIGYSADCRPGPMLMVEPTVDDAKSENRQRLQPMLEETECLARKLILTNTRKGGSTQLMKEFINGTILRLTGANSARGLRRMPARDLYIDEVDAYPGDVEGEGDPVSLLDARSSNFRRRKKILVSTPKIKGKSRIENAYLASDQRRYFVPCPHCGEMDYLRWDRVKWREDMPETAHVVCKHGCVIEERYKTWMMDPENGARWTATAPPEQIARAQAARRVGYHLPALYSPFGWKSWAECATQFLERKNDPSQFKTFVNTVLGETWDDRPGTVEPATLLARREKYENEVPNGVGVLVTAVDVQDDRFEVHVTGFGHGEESWAVDYFTIEGDPGEREVWADLDLHRDRTYLHQSGQAVPIEIMVIDAGGHHWDEVVAFCKSRLSRRIFAVHGTSRSGVDLVNKASTKNKTRARVFPLCVDTGKDTLWSRLKIHSPKPWPQVNPGCMHLPITAVGPESPYASDWCNKAYAEMLTSEYPERAFIRGRGWTWKWKQVREQNHVWDLYVYALAALRILGAPVINNLAARAELLARPLDGPAPPRPPKPPQPAPVFPRRRFVTGRGRLGRR